jgi:hypothetical protein
MFLIDEPIKLNFVSFLTQLVSHFVISSDLAGVKVDHFYQKIDSISEIGPIIYLIRSQGITEGTTSLVLSRVTHYKKCDVCLLESVETPS